MKTIVIQPAAARDAAKEADYLAGKGGLALSVRFSQAVEETFKQLADTPEFGSLREFANPALAGMRVWPVRGFRNHLIYYRPIPNGIEIIRLLHGARDADRIFNATGHP